MYIENDEDDRIHLGILEILYR